MMKQINNKRIYVFAFVLFIIDFIIKELVINNISKEIVVIKNFFSYNYVLNTGAAFSIFYNSVLFLSIISIIFLIMIIYYVQKYDFVKIEKISVTLILGGLIGNLYDRLVRGAVVDYLAFKIFGYNFPVFNFADILISFGIFMIIMHELRGDFIGIKSKRRERKNR